jgi:hypothetical protein
VTPFKYRAKAIGVSNDRQEFRRLKLNAARERSTFSEEFFEIKKTSRNANSDTTPRVVNNIPPDLPILDEELSIIEAYLNEVIIGITEVQDRKQR